MPTIGCIKICRNILQLIWGVVLFTSPISLCAESIDANFIIVKDQNIYSKIVKLTEASLKHRGVEVNSNIIEVAGIRKVPSLPPGRLITIGTRSAAYAYDNYKDRAITSALLTRSGFAQLATARFGSTDQAINNNVVPLILDQPISRFFALGSLLVPSAKTVGVLLGPANEGYLPVIEASAKAAGLELVRHTDNLA